jgi:outer membrane protein assembly factor BamB
MKRSAILLIPALLAAADWPRFRGPEGKGILETNLPVVFSPTQNVNWKTPLPPGHSSPILVGGKIILTAEEGIALLTIAIDQATGKELWRKQAPRSRRESMQQTNSHASSTPASDGTLVYVFFGDFGLLAYDLNGTERWRLPLGPFNNANGHGSSPIVANGLVVLACDQDTESYLLAVDAATGQVRWKTPRPETTRGYATPAVYTPKNGPVQVIVPGAFVVSGYNLATGDRLWWATGLGWQYKGTPIIDGDTVYINSWEIGGDTLEPPNVPTFEQLLKRLDRNADGILAREELDAENASHFWEIDLDSSGRVEARDWEFYRLRQISQNSIFALRLGGKGDVTSRIEWRFRRGIPNVPTPVLYRNNLFLIRNGGIATTLNPRSGEPNKQARLPGALDDYYASPVGAGGKVYMISQTCKISVLEAKDDWKVLATNDLDDQCFATPAIDAGHIYIRTKTALYDFSAASVR